MYSENKVKISNYSISKKGAILNIKRVISIKRYVSAFIFVIFFITIVAISGFDHKKFNSTIYKKYYFLFLTIGFVMIIIAHFKYTYKFKLQKQKNTRNLIAIKEVNGKNIEKTILKGGHFFWDIKCNNRYLNQYLGEGSKINTNTNRFQFTLRYFDRNKNCQAFLLSNIRLSHTVFLKKAQKTFEFMENYPIILTESVIVLCNIYCISIPKNAIILKNNEYENFMDLYDRKKYFQIVKKRLKIK